MNKVWRSSTYSTRTKLKPYHSCVLKSRRSIYHNSPHFTFHTLRIFWPNLISNEDFFECSGTEPMATNLMRRRCRWIVYVTRQETSIAKTAGRLKGNVRGTAPRTPGGGRYRKKLRRWARPGKENDGRCRGGTLLLYMSLRCKRAWVWVWEELKDRFITNNANFIIKGLQSSIRSLKETC